MIHRVDDERTPAPCYSSMLLSTFLASLFVLAAQTPSTDSLDAYVRGLMEASLCTPAATA